MTIRQWLSDSQKLLAGAGIDTARLDCLVLLEDYSGHNRAWLLAHDDEPAPNDPLLAQALQRRAQHEPLAYIRGFCEFYGRNFTVGPEVLVPRPETEAIVELVKQLALDTPIDRLADIGSGSGCLGITLALELPQAEVWLTDVYTNVYTSISYNARHLGAAIRWAEGDLLAALPPQPFDVVVANLPYVPNDYPVNQAAGYEPRQALFSGPDGLDHYRRFWQQAVTRQPRHVYTESLPEQHAENANLAATTGYALIKTTGFVQHFSI